MAPKAPKEAIEVEKEDADVAQTAAPDTKFSIEFEIPPDMLETFARIGLEFVLKQRMQEINSLVKK